MQNKNTVAYPSPEAASPPAAIDALLWEALPELTLNIAQTAALCGISVRQLGYWTHQGYVAAQGRGARRSYGLEALRRVLAIRKTMDGGASLQQALRRISGPASSASQRISLSYPAALLPDLPIALSSDESATLEKSLLAFFSVNRHTRDDASGLAIKIGRSVEDVHTAAEALCSAGLLSKSHSRGSTVFQRV